MLRGNVAAHSVSGDVQIGVRRGSKVFLDCNTVSGDTSSELELTPDAPAGDGPLVEIRAKTVSGDIRITRAPAPATDNAQTPGGARMNRLSWDTTAPRRPTGKRAVAEPAARSRLVEAEAELIRVAWDKPQRITPF